MAISHVDTLKHRRKHCRECGRRRCLRCLSGSWSAPVPLTSALEARYWLCDLEDV